MPVTYSSKLTAVRLVVFDGGLGDGLAELVDAPAHARAEVTLDAHETAVLLANRHEDRDPRLVARLDGLTSLHQALASDCRRQ